MIFFTFSEVENRFMTIPIDDKGCIAYPGNKNRCPFKLEPEQIDNAAELFQKGEYKTNVVPLRSIIDCLLCDECKKTNHQKKKIESNWQSELTQLVLSKPPGRSPSLSPSSFKVAIQNGGQSRALSRSFSEPSSTPQSERYLHANYHAAPPPQPDFTRKSQEESNLSPSTFRASRSNFSSSLQGPEYDETYVSAYGTADSQAENTIRAQTPLDSVVETTEPVEDQGEETREEYDEVADSAMGVYDSLGYDMSELEATTASPEAPNPFQVQEASTWAPWAIRSQVLSILLQPRPDPERPGTIYAIRAKDSQNVKIGFTMDQVGKRWSGIKGKHKLELETNAGFWLSGIPHHQLLRLEALVHADLAFFRRALTFPGKKKKHTEYFEVDLATAQRSIKTWWQVLQDFQREPGNEVNQDIYRDIKLNPALDMETIDEQGTVIPPERYADVNSNHALREKKWSKVFKLEERGISKSRAQVPETDTSFSAPWWAHIGVPEL